jgi:hypothetical protein
MQKEKNARNFTLNLSTTAPFNSEERERLDEIMKQEGEAPAISFTADTGIRQ